MTTKTDLKIIDYGHPLYMSMFTDEGNIQVSTMVNTLIYEIVKYPNSWHRQNLQTQLRDDMETLYEAGYTEIFDTEVRMAIAKRLNEELLVPMKWQKIDYFFEDVEA
jgi:hypothetical protein